MSREIWHHKVELAMERASDIDFPQFLHQLRDLLGFTRKTICMDTGISPAKLLDLEYGHFCFMPKEDVLQSLSQYYEIPVNFLRDKCRSYCQKSQEERKKFKKLVYKRSESPADMSCTA